MDHPREMRDETAHRDFRGHDRIGLGDIIFECSGASEDRGGLSGRVESQQGCQSSQRHYGKSLCGAMPEWQFARANDNCSAGVRSRSGTVFSGAQTRPKPSAAPAAVGNAVFPSAVSGKYSSESAGKARFHTCLDQYRANKANGGNGGLKWIEKGDGYYSECNKRLKGQT
jgi:hypothetical protein